MVEADSPYLRLTDAATSRAHAYGQDEHDDVIIDSEDKQEVQQLFTDLKAFRTSFHQRLVALLEQRQARHKQKVQKIKQLKAEILADIANGADQSQITEKIINNRKNRENRAGLLPGKLGYYLDGDTIDGTKIEERLLQTEQAWERGLSRLDAKMKDADWKSKLLKKIDEPIQELDDITLMVMTDEEILTERQRMKEDAQRLRLARNNLIESI